MDSFFRIPLCVFRAFGDAVGIFQMCCADARWDSCLLERFTEILVNAVTFPEGIFPEKPFLANLAFAITSLVVLFRKSGICNLGILSGLSFWCPFMAEDTVFGLVRVLR